MRKLLWGAALMAVVGTATVAVADIVYKPVDTNKYVVQPSRAAAGMAARTIDAAGRTAAGALDNNGYIKTINNLFSKKIIVPTTQAGRSALPSPNLFPSTRYKSYNTPAMPRYQTRQRR